MTKEEKTLYHKNRRILEKYAKDFCDSVRSNKELPFELTDLLTIEYPKMHFYSLEGIIKKHENNNYLENISEELNGNYIIEGLYDDGQIEIYGLLKYDLEKLKENVRHECLHFLLDKSGLPYDDTNEIFLILAMYFNATPYGILKNPEFKEKIDLLINN